MELDLALPTMNMAVKSGSLFRTAYQQVALRAVYPDENGPSATSRHSSTKTSRPGELVYGDIEVLPVEEVGGYNYFVT